MAATNRVLRGIAASPGVAIGPAFWLRAARLTPPRRSVADTATELSRLDAALAEAGRQLAALGERAAREIGADEAAIFAAHVQILLDPTLLKRVRSRIESEQSNADYAWAEGCQFFVAQLEAIPDETLRARAADLRDVEQRVLRILAGRDEAPSGPQAAAIIVADDLTPSDTAMLDKTLVLGLCTAQGGPTSHAAILARALGLPAILGVGESLAAEVQAGDLLVLDGGLGELTLDPDEAQLGLARQAQAAANEAMGRNLKAAHQPAVTTDGREIEIVANIGSVDEAAGALEFGAEGVGLLRTEFLYLDRQTAPDEEQQFAAYAAILNVMGSRPVVARTLDIGGDKQLPYMDLGEEANPFLGWRAIRISLDLPELFKTQVRALLRASQGHDLRIMFPMIATLEEWRRARQLVTEVADSLRAEGGQVGAYQLGIMIEIPSAALLCDQFAREVDFFSIGTNDLCQYVMAADRTNKKVAWLSDACHPAVLRLIGNVVEAAHREGIWVGVCGELAGDVEAAPLLLGLGVDELSMAPASIPAVKAALRTWSYSAAQELAAETLALDSAPRVRERLQAAKATK